MTRQQRQRARRRASGLCVRCGRTLHSPNRANCFPCALKEADRRAKQRASKREASA
jgi:hypothetical protein